MICQMFYPQPYLIYLLMILNAYTCTSILCTSPQSTLNQTLLQNDINALFDYGNSWHLFFDNTKCAHLHFHFNPETKDLGITFNTNLHWDQHYKNITSRAYKCLHLYTKMNIQYTCNCLKKAIIHIASKISINLLFPTLATVLTQGNYYT